PKEIAAYCLTALGTSALSGFVGNSKQIFMMNYMGLTGTAYGFLTGVSTAWDALDDPISGVVIDRMRTRWGRLRPFLIFPIPFWAITSVLMFIIPTMLNANERVIYAMVITILNGIGNSYLGGWNLLLYNITPNTLERSSLVATQKFVELFNYLPALVPVFVDFLPKLTDNGIVQSQVYGGASVFFVIFAVATALFGFFNMRERIPQATKEEMKETGILKSFVTVLKNSPFIALMLANFCGSIGGIRGSAGEDFFWLNCTGKLSNRFLASLFTGLPNYVTTPMAPGIIRRFGVRKTAMLGSCFSGLGWVLLYVVGYAPTPNAFVNFCWITFMLTVLGLPNRVIGVCDPLLMGDMYDYLEWKSGMRSEGVVNAVNGYVGKLSGSVIGVFSGVVYDIIKFKPNLDRYGNAIPHTNPDVLRGIFGIFTLIPAIAKFGYAAALLLFNVHGKFKIDMNEELDRRRKAKASEK
ncbi:MAG: hypothetical protein GX851_06120, partial [Clostridiales bacterium]|nr:hypothetical protein [Clostridiales bacterium]